MAVRRSLMVALVVLASTVAAAPAQARRPVPVVVDVAPEARLVDGGRAALLRVKVRCPSGFRVLEAFAYLTQAGNQSDFGGLPATCDGKPHLFTVRVSSFQGEPAFRPGRAVGTGFLLIVHRATGKSRQGDDTQPLRLRF
jgi:hypothetical protein